MYLMFLTLTDTTISLIIILLNVKLQAGKEDSYVAHTSHNNNAEKGEEENNF